MKIVGVVSTGMQKSLSVPWCTTNRKPGLGSDAATLTCEASHLRNKQVTGGRGVQWLAGCCCGEEMSLGLLWLQVTQAVRFRHPAI